MDPAFPFFIGTDAAVRPGLFRLGLVQRGAPRLLHAGKTLTLAGGTIFLLPPGAGCWLLKDHDSSIQDLSFGRSLVDPLTLGSSIDIIVETMAAPGPQVARLPASEYEEARALFLFMKKESAARRAGYQAMVRLKLMEAILMLARARIGNESPGLTGPIRFHPTEALQYIQERYADQLSLQQIASRYGLNPSYFSRLFHRHEGVSLVEYVNRVRIQKSCQLLKRSEAGIIEIALAVGYNNISHFNRYFRRIMGMSPREYRNSSKR